jgi:hypothetical protein
MIRKMRIARGVKLTKNARRRLRKLCGEYNTWQEKQLAKTGKKQDKLKRR